MSMSEIEMKAINIRVQETTDEKEVINAGSILKYGRETSIDGITGQLLKYDVICFHSHSVLGNRTRKCDGSIIL